jgi:phosphonoacetaldehyde hydrolase
MTIQAVLFDFIGTLVKERDPHTVNRCFEQAFWDMQLEVDHEFIQQYRGRNKKEVFELIVKQKKLDSAIIPSLYASFKMRMEQELDNFVENDGVQDIFNWLRSNQIKVGVGTGLTRDLFDLITEQLNWSNHVFDYIGIADEVGAGRPNPVMIFAMMKQLTLSNKNLLIKVGDTVSDIQEGRNAGVMTVALDSGTQPREQLMQASPDFIISTLSELRHILTN